MARRKALSVEARLRKMKQLRREKQLALMKEMRLFPTKHRILLPRPEGSIQPVPLPVTQVVASSSPENIGCNVAGVSSCDPKAAPVKKVYILGPNSVLYEAVVATASQIQGSAPPNQGIMLQTMTPAISIQNSTLLKQSSAEIAQEFWGKPSSFFSSSAVDSGPDTPVKETQVKVELSDFLCDEKLPFDENDTEIITRNKTPVSDGEESLLANTPSLIKKEILSDDDENESRNPSSNHIIKIEELLIKKEFLESPRSPRIGPDRTTNKYENVQKLDPVHPRIVPFRPNQTNSDDSLYCDECSRDYEGDCPEHGPLIVVDDIPVTADVNDKLRAKKTAPSIVFIADSGSGVWARDVILARTRFGPFDGKIVSTEVCTPHTWMIRLNGKCGFCIDAGEPGLSNWMRYVASARRVGEQNLRPFQRFGKLYFRTTRRIEPHEQLLLEDDAVEKVADDGDFFEAEKERTYEDSMVDMNQCEVPCFLFVDIDTVPKDEEDDFS